MPSDFPPLLGWIATVRLTDGGGQNVYDLKNVESRRI